MAIVELYGIATYDANQAREDVVIPFGITTREDHLRPHERVVVLLDVNPMLLRTKDMVHRPCETQMHDPSKCPICRRLPVGSSMSDEEFSAFLAACRAELADKQTRFQQRLAGAGRWFYDMADCSINIGDERFGMTPIGTHSAEYQTWLWAWANEDFPAVARESSRSLLALHALTGFRVFLDAGIAASAADAEDFAALAAHQLEAIGIFRSTSDQVTLYLAVHSNSVR